MLTHEKCRVYAPRPLPRRVVSLLDNQIRLLDETQDGEQSAELDMDALREALEKEEVRGKFHKRIRRKKDAAQVKKEDEWDVLGTARKRTGRFFVVEGGKK